LIVAGQGVVGEVLFVLAQFRTENRFTLFLSRLSAEDRPPLSNTVFDVGMRCQQFKTQRKLFFCIQLRDAAAIISGRWTNETVHVDEQNW
jgi:hypothetical protein